MRHPEGGGRLIVDTVGDMRQPGDRNGDLLGERAVHSHPADPLADRETICTLTGFDNRPGELATGNERCGHADLILVRDEQHVGKVHRRGADPDADLPRCDGRSRQLLDADHIRRSIRRTDRGPHR